MSVFTGTAANYADLLIKLYGHLTADLAVADRWIVHRWYGWRDVIASSHLDTFEADKGIDADVSTQWLTAQGQALNSWLAVQLIAPLDLRQFAITGAITVASSPAAFDLQYSADGSAWTTLQSWSAQTWTASQRKVFAVTATSPGTQSWWRIRITANGGDVSYSGFIRWELLQDITPYGTLNHGDAAQLFMHGPDAAGAAMPYVGLQLYRSTTSDIYNWRSLMADGFNPAATLTGQPGTSSVLGTPLWNGSIPYQVIANGRRFILLANFAGQYEVLHAGLHLRRRTPGQYPYPAALLTSLTSDALTRYDVTSRVSGWKGGRLNCEVKDQANAWGNPDVWPYNNTTITRRDAGGNYPLQPLVLNAAPGILGELEGLYHVSGFSNVAGNTVTIGADNYLVVPDIARTGIADYCGLALS